MSRYIDADNLQEEFKKLHGGKRSLLIDTEPTADVRENIKAEWIFPFGDRKYKRCSFCGKTFYSIPSTSNFCPNCGAQMIRGES